MCFHYSLTKERAEIEIQLGAAWDDDWEPVNYVNGFTFPKMPIITQKKPGSIIMSNWGLIPHWVKTKEDADKLRAQTLNARSETVFEKPSFRSFIHNNRCLIIADGFFEWMDFQKKKYPHYIYLKSNSLFCFAGIYSSWTDKKTGEFLETHSILTIGANPMLSRIHNNKERMPVIIPPDQYKRWLAPDLPKAEIQSFFTSYPETDMQNHTISKLITSKNENPNVPEVTEPFIYPELALAE
jgi:putative SOS response-associated peptidase YedK